MKKPYFLKISGFGITCLGIILITYMVTIESEVGAVPILLLVIGFSLLFINYKILKT